MSPEFDVDRAYNLYSGNIHRPTPHQVQSAINNNGYVESIPSYSSPARVHQELTEIIRQNSLMEQTGITDPEVLNCFLSKSGEIIKEKFDEYCKSLARLTEKYGEEIINFVDPKMIKPTGGLYEAKIKRKRKAGLTGS